ncbi:MAG: phosphoribosylformylglycinamidine cyclo-ligase [Candidatus Aegiribacteria sp.]|nr:phosphoribosylformylglycinamidine cyclo-ligase [Candidatus Aegiribacteria sp.]
MTQINYRDSGVDIKEGEKAVALMKENVRSTFTKEVLSDLGHFGGLFQADFPDTENPVLVASTDGVGTKLKVASMTSKYDTVGQDLVNHCVNDILVQGARPLFFMDYIACGKLEASVITSIVSGLAVACRENGCALLGGETAEMPGFYSEGDYDVAGTIIGLVDKSMIIDGSTIRPGMTVIGLPSNGLHTNGYSLARKVLFEIAEMSSEDKPPLLEGATIGEALLAVHKSYLNVIKPLLKERLIQGIAHITGGGIPGNLSRILPEGCGALIDEKWEIPRIFEIIRERGNIDRAEMRIAFNMGAGMLIVVKKSDSDRTLEILQESGELPFLAGEITSQEGISFKS